MYIGFASVYCSKHSDSSNSGYNRNQDVSSHGQDIQQIKQSQRHLNEREQFAVKAEASGDNIVIGKCCYKHFVADKLESRKGRHKDAHEPTHILRDTLYSIMVIQEIADDNYAQHDKAELIYSDRLDFPRAIVLCPGCFIFALL